LNFQQILQLLLVFVVLSGATGEAIQATTKRRLETVLVEGVKKSSGVKKLGSSLVEVSQGCPSGSQTDLQVIPGGDGVAYNGAWVQGNEGGDKAFDGNLNTFWDAGSGDNAQTGWSVDNWIIFQASNGGALLVSSVAFATYGDTTHDATSYVLSGGNSQSGPWTKLAGGGAQSGISTWQSFPVQSTGQTYTYFKIEFPTRPQIYQAWVREVALCGCSPSQVSLQVIPGGDGVAYNGAWVQGNEGGDKAFDGNLNTFWDAGSGDNAQTGWSVDNWIVFQASNGGALLVTGLTFATYGDTTHDATSYVLSGGNSQSGPWTQLAGGGAQTGNSAPQQFSVTSGQAYTYFKLEFPTRPQIYQVWVREITLTGCSGSVAPPPPPPSGGCPKAYALAQMRAKLLKKKQK